MNKKQIFKTQIMKVGKVSKNTLGWPSDPKTETYRPMWETPDNG